jgi:hypothetical protein
MRDSTRTPPLPFRSGAARDQPREHRGQPVGWSMVRLDRASAEKLFERPTIAPVFVEPVEPIEFGLAHETLERKLSLALVVRDPASHVGREGQAVRKAVEWDGTIHGLTSFIVCIRMRASSPGSGGYLQLDYCTGFGVDQVLPVRKNRRCQARKTAEASGNSR